MIFDRVICASGEEFGDLGPFIAMFLLVGDDDLVFFFGPGAEFEVWIQMVVPSLAALFAYPTLQIAGDQAPGRPVFFYQPDHDLVFFAGPGPLCELGI